MTHLEKKNTLSLLLVTLTILENMLKNVHSLIKENVLKKRIKKINGKKVIVEGKIGWEYFCSE